MTNIHIARAPDASVAGVESLEPSAVSDADGSLGEYPATVVASALDRVLRSKTFLRSRRHRHFLEHVIQASVEGRQSALREVVIGLDVFARDAADYDPRRDPIVRVEAGRVREKLARYYASEGAGDPFQIEIPVGGYLPQLIARRARRARDGRFGSLTILPFNALSQDPDDVAFCEALGNQLVDALSRVPGLRVVGRTSARRARETALSHKALGELLGVTSVVEGSVQRLGSRYRCIVQLFRTRDAVCLWSQRFEGAFDAATDVFALQDRICDAVLAAVTQREEAAAASPSASAPAAPSSSARTEARDLFERGRYLGQRMQMEDCRRAIGLFERAVALEPTMARAYSQLAAVRARLAMLVAAPVGPAFDDVARDAQRALELDPQDGDARAILGNITFRLKHDPQRAGPMFLEALAAAPNSTRAHTLYGAFLVYTGRYAEGLQHVRISIELDPLNVALRGSAALTYAFARDYATAVKEFETVLDLEPDDFFARVMLGMTQTWRGDHEAALPHFSRAHAIAPNHPVPGFCRAVSLGARGRVDEGHRFLAAHVERIGDAPYARYNRAMAEAYLQDRDAMYASLRVASVNNDEVMSSLATDPTFDRYRGERQLTSLLDAHRLPNLRPADLFGRGDPD